MTATAIAEIMVLEQSEAGEVWARYFEGSRGSYFQLPDSSWVVSGNCKSLGRWIDDIDASKDPFERELRAQLPWNHDDRIFFAVSSGLVLSCPWHVFRSIGDAFSIWNQMRQWFCRKAGLSNMWRAPDEIAAPVAKLNPEQLRQNCPPFIAYEPDTSACTNTLNKSMACGWLPIRWTRCKQTKSKEADVRIELRLPERAELEPHLSAYDESLDSIVAILTDVCRAIEQDDRAELWVSGFGQQRWPVDVGTDLVVMLEQLPGVIRSLAAGEPAELSFYEQGIERTLLFTPVGDRFEIVCESWNSHWEPDPSHEQIERADLVAMLTAVQDRFLGFLRNSSPRLAEHPRVMTWLEGASV